MASNLLKFSFCDRKIYCLSKKVGTFKVKKWDKEKKCKVETGDIKPWKFQKFSISLGKKGSQSLGFIEVQYWGDKDLEEGKCIHKGFFFLKQDKWDTKDPTTFITKKHAKHCLVMTDFDCLVNEPANKKYERVKNLTPEESIALGKQEYEDKDGYEQEHSAEMVDTSTLSFINEEPDETIKVNDLEIKNEVK